MNNEKIKILLPSLLVVIIIFCGYFWYKSYSSGKPYLSVAPTNYATGTTISLYKDIAPGFPNEVILEDNQLQYSGTTATASGRSKTTISYTTNKIVSDTTALYLKTLPTIGWSIEAKTIYEKVAILRVKKGGSSLVITIATAPSSGSLVTFQYEK